MLQLIALFGFLIILGSGYGLADPQGLLRVIGRFSGVAGYVFAIIVRLILGLAALVAAPASLHPLFLQIVGGLALLAAAVLLIIGRPRFARLIEWARSFSPGLLRLSLLFGMLFGVALVWVTDIV